jgi:hypothetical protein
LAKPLVAVAGLAVAGVLTLAVPACAAVSGAYLEARTADLYRGRCTDTSLGDGRSAILAWRVEEGDFEGVPLAGLAVVAVVRGETALSASAGPEGSPVPHSLILVDQTASEAQRQALAALVRAEAGSVLGEVIGVEPAPIELAVDPSRALARLRVADLAELRTRPFNRLDALCGDETMAAPPLARGVEATPAVALEHAFRSDALGPAWDAANGRGAFVGTFQR